MTENKPVWTIRVGPFSISKWVKVEKKKDKSGKEYDQTNVSYSLQKSWIDGRDEKDKPIWKNSDKIVIFDTEMSSLYKLIAKVFLGIKDEE